MSNTNGYLSKPKSHLAGRLTTDRRRRSPLAMAALASVLVTSLIVPARTAHAEEVSPTGKGIAGGALLGAELVTFGEAIFDVRSPTAYIVGAGAGAVAGGVGGYFVEQSVDDGRVPAYMLAGGLVLLIPAVVVALDQTRYMPDQGAREDKAPQPPADPGKPGGSAVVGASASTSPASGTTAATEAATPPQPQSAPATPQPSGSAGGASQGPQSLVNVREGGFYMGVPLPDVRPAFTAAQAQKLAVQNTVSEVRFPVVRVQF